jgi:hypothetical protein
MTHSTAIVLGNATYLYVTHAFTFARSLTHVILGTAPHGPHIRPFGRIPPLNLGHVRQEIY